MVSRPATTPRASAAPTVFVIGAGAAARVEVAVVGPAAPNSAEPFDADWLAVEVEIAADVFAGRFAASFRSGDFVRFRDELSRLHADLTGDARFATIEDQLALHLRGDGRGRIQLDGRASHPLGGGNALHFCFQLDQTQLAEPLRQLERIVTAYPEHA